MTVCVTGAGGYIGAHLVKRLCDRKRSVVAIERSKGTPAYDSDGEVRCVRRELAKDKAPLKGIGDVDCVVHLAGLAHGSAGGRNGTDLFMEQNCAVAVRLAENAVDAGVRRFILVSSIAIYGDSLTQGDAVVDERTQPLPNSPYGLSKLAAEKALRRLSDSTGLEVVVVRPALVVGVGAPGNLERLATFISRGIPFPVPLRDNNRSYIGIDDLCELLGICIDHPSAGGNTFIAANNEYVSTREVVRWIGDGMGTKTRTIRLPASIIKSVLTATGHHAVFDKLYGNLMVSSTKAQRMLEWHPVTSLQASFRSLGCSHLGMKR